MKSILYILFAIICFSACRTSKDYLQRSDPGKALNDAVKMLQKDPDDEKALEAIPILYQNIRTKHLANIDALKMSRDIGKWDKLVGEYKALQNAYELLVNNTAAYRITTPESFAVPLAETREAGAAEFYQLGNQHLQRNTRNDAKKAYNYFKKADNFVPGYEETGIKIDSALRQALVRVVVHRLDVRSGRFTYNWRNQSNRYSNGYFEEMLVRDLNNRSYPVEAYLTEDAYRLRINADWEIDLELRNLNMPYPYQQTSRYNRSSQIEVGRDTSNRPIFQTVYATLNVTRRSFTAEADMYVRITDAETRESLQFRSFREEYRWDDQVGTYTGDSRALNSSDWNIINNRNQQMPREEEILDELFRKLYPRVRNYVTDAVSW